MILAVILAVIGPRLAVRTWVAKREYEMINRDTIAPAIERRSLIRLAVWGRIQYEFGGCSNVPPQFKGFVLTMRPQLFNTLIYLMQG